jgi:CubicO group peptidase (beta-lactamase class C family)
MKMNKRLLFLLSVILFVNCGTQAQSLIDDPRVASAIKVTEAWIDSQLDYNDIPGMSVGIVYDQELVWSRGFGFADVDRKVPASPDTIYSICSISKLFTSIGIMQLRDEGKLRLDDPIGKYLSWFNIKDKYPDAPEVTIGGILTHSSGLPREADYPYWTGPEFNFPTLEQIIEALSGQEELYPADTFYQYSNLGMALLGEVIATISGKPYAEYIQEHILTPLGLKDTSPEIPEEERGKQLATGYSARLRDGSRKVIPFYLVNGIAPAAGFASTVEDLARFASWQLRLLEKGGWEMLASNTLKEMQRVHWLDPDWRTTRGLGFSVSRRDDKTYVGHGGNCPGYRTQLSLLPKDKIAVIVMSNAHDASPSSYAYEIFDLAAPAILDAVKNPEKAKKPDPELAKFVGRYEMPIGWESMVVIWEGELAVLYIPTDNPSDALTKLRRVEGNIFRRVRDDGELGEKVIFEVGPDGEVTRMIQHSQYSIRIR